MSFLFLKLHSVSSTNNVDALFQLEKKVDANDDVATLLRTTKRFIGSSKALPSERIDIQKISEFSLREDNGEAASKKVSFPLFFTSEQNPFHPVPSLRAPISDPGPSELHPHLSY